MIYKNEPSKLHKKDFAMLHLNPTPEPRHFEKFYEHAAQFFSMGVKGCLVMRLFNKVKILINPVWPIIRRRF